MNKGILTIIILTFFTSALFAQSKKAETILKEVAEKTQSYRSIKMDFTYKMENPEAGIDESEQGVILIKGDKYRLSIAGQVVINDGTTIWTYLEDAAEVQINEVDEDDEAVISPTKLLTTYDDSFKPKYIKEDVWLKHKVHIIELKPKEDKSYSKLILKTDIEKKRVLQIAIYDNSGNVFTYTVDEFKPNVLFDHSDFEFNTEDYPEVEVIDMR